MRGLILLGALAVAGCGDGLSQPTRPAASALGVRFEPESTPDAVAPIVHIHLTGALELRSLGLFQGTLSSYALGRIKSGDYPATLSERQLPLVAFRAPEEIVVAPARALEAGSYSLASSQGLLAELVVSASDGPRLERVWPPPEGAGHFVYCAREPLAPAQESPLEPLVLEPGELSVQPAAGVDASGVLGDRCLSFDAGEELASSSVLVLPVAVAGVALDPLPIVTPSASAAAALACAQGELQFGFGCALVDDDRLLVRTPDAPLFWRVSTQGGGLAQATLAGSPLVIRGLRPDTRESLEGAAYDALGNVRPLALDVHTLPAHDHLVVSEVLANPLGPEPASEWVEIVNDGAAALSLAGFALHDAKSENALPAAELAPGEYALLVREDFTPGSGDVAPRAGTQLLRLPELGSGGLSNSGEVVFLTNASGATISAFPPLAPRAGDSVARRYPWSPDGAASSFTTGAPTPGAPNE